MGIVEPEEARRGLAGAVRFFRDYVSKLNNLTCIGVLESYFMVILLGVYLYSKYYKCGIRRSSGYTIVASTVYNLYYDYDEDIANTISSVIAARNIAVHAPYIDRSNKQVKAVLNNKHLIRLLRCEGIIDKDGNFIEPADGEYKSVSGEKEALAKIKKMVDKINAEDKEADKSNNNKSSNGFMVAASIMGGSTAV